MGNNSYLPILDQGSVIISLNGQRILVWNALHVLGLVVPLYSHRAHFTCGFIGASGVGILVWFPTFINSGYFKGLPPHIQIFGMVCFS
jgi:hypothetical protein